MTKPLIQSRDEYNRAQRERHRERVPKVSRRQIRFFRRDPLREERLGIKDHVVCRECGAKLLRLHGGPTSHLSVHGLSLSNYQKKWPGGPVICESLQHELSRRGKRQMEQTRGRSSLLKSVRGHAGEQPAPKWPIVCALVNGKGYTAAGREKRVNRRPMTVWTAAQSMGFGGESKAARTAPTVYDLGVPVTAALIRQLQQNSGLLLVREFAGQIGVPLVTAQGAIRSRREGQRISPRIAEKIVRWRRESAQRLLATAPKSDYRADRYSGSRVLKTFFPDLRRCYELLRAAIPQIRAFVQRDAVEAAKVGEFLCQQAMFETGHRSRRRVFTRFLPLAARHAESKTFIERHLDRFKSGGSPGSLAFGILAAELGATPAVISGALDRNLQAIPPSEMRHLLASSAVLASEASAHTLAPQLAPPSPKRKYGPDKKPAEQSVWFEIGRKVEELVGAGESLEDARQHVCGNYEYDSIVRYHKRYRALLRSRDKVT